ncbi:hypothetical protein SAMN04488131_10770 [Flavobacterium xueshanense]|uniref:Uncharacterized protein n=1 Tax=Flavobacterium xueshanense TaxID=935223 RepID=A0A1I2F929_9FLAO|nr:hypothetical protein SAMN04488131_10770 [Flavobacterium xueshanense]
MLFSDISTMQNSCSFGIILGFYGFFLRIKIKKEFITELMDEDQTHY